MYTARRGVQAVVALLLSGVVSSPTFSQSPRFLSVEAHSARLLGPSFSTHPCSLHPDSPLAALPEDTLLSGNTLRSCGFLMATDDRPAPSAPCNLTTQSTHPCSASSDIVRDLNTMGKQGQIILRARDKVLEILQTENACSAWYRTKDPNPAATFRTLTFALDRDGDVHVRVMREPGGIQLIRNPYVARVLQAGGADSIVTLNLNSAFFFSAGTVVDERIEGGPVIMRGPRPINVGPYSGGSFRAQVLALLHEFGHVIDLLPADHDDYEGRSRQNTEDVLLACRAQVESKEAQHAILASR